MFAFALLLGHSRHQMRYIRGSSIHRKVPGHNWRSFKRLLREKGLMEPRARAVRGSGFWRLRPPRLGIACWISFLREIPKQVGHEQGHAITPNMITYCQVLSKMHRHTCSTTPATSDTRPVTNPAPKAAIRRRPKLTNERIT